MPLSDIVYAKLSNLSVKDKQDCESRIHRNLRAANEGDSEI